MMRLLLDTHVFLWIARGERRTSRRVLDAVLDPGNEIFLSVVSRWEIALKQHKADFQIAKPFETVFRASTYLPLDLTFDVPAVLAGLPPIHKDPFDRIIVAQALSASLTLVTRDSEILKYDVPLFW